MKNFVGGLSAKVRGFFKGVLSRKEGPKKVGYIHMPPDRKKAATAISTRIRKAPVAKRNRHQENLMAKLIRWYSPESNIGFHARIRLAGKALKQFKGGARRTTALQILYVAMGTMGRKKQAKINALIGNTIPAALQHQAAA